MSLTPTSKNFECAVCGDTSGDCRQSEQGGWLCITEVGAKQFDIINGWKKVGVSDGDLWGIFVEDSGDSSDYTNRAIERQQEAERKAAAARQRNLSRMPIVERDSHYQEILSQLSLCDVDRADLRRRGFTNEQIERYGFKSIDRYQPLSGKFPKNLPGISEDLLTGGKLASRSEQHSTTLTSMSLGTSLASSTLTGELTAESFTIRTIYIPDAGDITNAKVMPRISRQFNLLKELGLRPRLLRNRTIRLKPLR